HPGHGAPVAKRLDVVADLEQVPAAAAVVDDLAERVRVPAPGRDALEPRAIGHGKDRIQHPVRAAVRRRMLTGPRRWRILDPGDPAMMPARAVTAANALLGFVTLLECPVARAQRIEPIHETWTVSNHTTDHYEGIYGQPQWIPLEEILRGNAPRTGAIRTRGFLGLARQRVEEGRGVSYSLGVGSGSTTVGPASLAIMPAVPIRGELAFEAASLNLREIESVGTLEEPVGPDLHTVSGFWFWSYAGPPEPGGARVAGSCGALTVADLVRSSPAAGERRSVKVCGQFRGRNLFGDLDGEAPQPDAWVIRDGGLGLWVTGKAPEGDGFALDLGSRGDAKHWVEVEGRLETRDGRSVLKASRVALVSPADAAKP